MSDTAVASASEIKPGKLFINGEWRDGKEGKTRPTISPATEEVITEIAQATEEDVNDAVEAADKAFHEGPWSRMGPHDRARLLIKVAELVEKSAPELAYRESIDMGKPIYFSKMIDCRLLADLFYYYAGAATRLEGSTRPATPPAPGLLGPLNYTRREPLGVVAAITPFNFPLLLSGTKLAPALAAGNTVIHKPASATPLSALKMAEIFAEAGLPEGVFNLVTGPGAMVGNALVKHPRVKKIGFTGSTATGSSLPKML